MSDKEIIIKSLEKVARRLRTNRLFRDLTGSFSLFLLFPLAFKVWDLFLPFRGTTVAIVLFIWFSLFVLYFLPRLLQMGTLKETAAQLDKKVGFCDELKTAYWFITHPRASDWIDSQIRRASNRVSQLSIDRLYPRVIPASTYLAAGLLALLIGLNFLPLPSNHNWVFLQAAPHFSLTDAEQTFLAQAQELLRRTDQLNKTDLAARIEQIIKDLEEGRIDAAEAVRELEEIQKLLDTPALDAAAVAQKLNEIADDLKTSEQLKEAAEALQDKNLEDTAEKMKKAAEELEATAESLKDQDQNAAAKAMQGAVYLKELADKLQDQELKEQASKELQEFAQSLQQRTTGSPQIAKGGSRRNPANQMVNCSLARNLVVTMPTRNQKMEAMAGRGRHLRIRVRPRKMLRVRVLQRRNWMYSFCRSNSQDNTVRKPAPRRSRKRANRNDRNWIIGMSPSQLSAAERDVLSQKQIPWEYRSLIKQYFAAIQPQKKN